MKMTLLVSMILLGSSLAQAGEVVLAQCRGSIVENEIGENYQVVVTDKEELVVEGQYTDSLRIRIPYKRENIIINSDKTLVASYNKRAFGVSVNKKSVVVDFVTGKGKATQYEAFDTLTKSRVVYLNHCTRN